MKNKKIINVICYIITAALAVFYLSVLVSGQKRQVSQEYDLYYVDGELSKWPGEHGLDYNFGDVDIYDISKLDEYKKLLEEEKLYGDPSRYGERDEDDKDDENDADNVVSNRDSAIDKYFQKMLAAQKDYLTDTADDKSGGSDTDDLSGYDTSDKSSSTLNIPYRYTNGFYSLHTGIYTTSGKEAALYYRFTVNVPSDVILEVYGASYNTTTKVYANETYIGSIESYEDAEETVRYYKNEYGDKIREDKVNNNCNVFTIPVEAIAEDGLVKLTFVPEETVSIYNYINSIGNDNFKKYKGFRITSVNMCY